MKDLYSAQHYQKFLQKQKKKEKKTAVDEEIENKAKELEEQNYDMAHEARKKLQAGYQTQKKTTKELLSQGERLEKADADTKEIHSNVKEGKRLTKKIKEEGKLFNFKLPFVGRVKKIFSLKKKEPEEAQNKETHNPPEEIQNKKIGPNKKLIPNQGKTDAELEQIYTTLKNVKHGAEFQHEEMQRQQKNIQNIGERTKKSKKEMEDVTQDLKKL